MSKKKALIMVDLQNDFCEGGHLAVPDGDEIIPLANQLQPYFDLVVATQDWHPHDHTSFAANHSGYGVGDVVMIREISQVLWPEHCVQETKGAEFHQHLDMSRVAHIVHKGVDKYIDSYSAFFDNAHLRSTGLADYLRNQGVEDIYLMGLATDYCVKYSTLDAVYLGFNVYVIEDACRGINLNPHDIADAFNAMKKVGVHLVSVNDVMRAHDNSKVD